MKYLYKIEGAIFLIILVSSFFSIYTLIRYILYPIMYMKFWDRTFADPDSLIFLLTEMKDDAKNEIKLNGVVSFINSWIKY